MRYKTRVVTAARRGGGIAAAAASAERHTLAAVGAAAALGFLKRNNVQLPKVDALGTPGTYGVVLWALARWSKSRVAGHMATGLLCLAAYDFAQTVGVPGAVMSGDGGDEGMSGSVDCGEFAGEEE